MNNQPLCDLLNCCENALYELYPAGIPNEVSQRFEQEIDYLSEKPDSMMIFCCLRNLAMQSSEPAGNYILQGR